MANGQPPMTVVPGQGWVDVASRVVVQVGFPIVVAGVLLWYVLGHFQQDMSNIVARMAANTEIVAELTKAQQETVAELKTQTQTLEKIVAYSDKILQIQQERQRLYYEKGKVP